jgi:hypothetical protein
MRTTSLDDHARDNHDHAGPPMRCAVDCHSAFMAYAHRAQHTARFLAHGMAEHLDAGIHQGSGKCAAGIDHDRAAVDSYFDLLNRTAHAVIAMRAVVRIGE